MENTDQKAYRQVVPYKEYMSDVEAKAKCNRHQYLVGERFSHNNWLVHITAIEAENAHEAYCDEGRGYIYEDAPVPGKEDWALRVCYECYRENIYDGDRFVVERKDGNAHAMLFSAFVKEHKLDV